MFILVFLPYKKAMTQFSGQRLVKILSDTIDILVYETLLRALFL